MNEIIVDKIVNQWGSKEYRGRGRITIPAYFDARAIILRILQRIYSKNKETVNVLVDDFDTRMNFITYITNQEDKSNNEEFKQLIADKKLRIVTENLFNDMHFIYRDRYIIMYNLDKYESQTEFRIEGANFVFDINVKPPTNEVILKLPIITSVTAEELDSLRITTPIEETQVGVHIDKSSKEYEDLEKLNKYIATALNIFEDFDTIKKARVGDPENGLSANDICVKIAKANGWDYNLDMSLVFNQKIDETYNPNSLADLAYNSYDYIRARKELLSSYIGKIDKVKEIIGGIKDVKNLIIICKKSDFVISLATELNRVYGENFCRPICDKLAPIPAIDYSGNPIYFKTGPNKGKRKILGAIAQQTLYDRLYNANKIKCLILSNAPSKSLVGDVRYVIITSPSCMTMEGYMYRLPYLRYPNNKVILYNMYCVDTQEQKQILKENETKFHTIVKNTEQVDDNGNFVPKIFVG